MSIWTVFKILTGLIVIAVIAFSGKLAWHILVAPQGRVFEKIVPHPKKIVGAKPEPPLTEILAPGNVPVVDPGAGSFEKAREMLAMGRIGDARGKLTSITANYPSSPSAVDARRILSQMNLDEILSAQHKDGKQSVVVKRGDSYLAIAARNQTTLDMIQHLNQMGDFKGLQPGEKLLVASLNYRVVIDTKRKTVGLQAGDQFVSEWPAKEMPALKPTGAKPAKISSKLAVLDGKNVAMQSKDYRAAEKMIQTGDPAVLIRGWDGFVEKPISGILLSPPDMEDLFLLTRSQNEVEIR
ncbi:MAG: LysM domain-containing protein [Verrucomicrobiota bacterium]